MKELFNSRRPGFWLLLAALLVIVFLMAEQRLQVPLSNELDEEDYVFDGPASVLAGEQFLLVENHPQTTQEELVYLDFLYSVNKDFSKLQNILAPIKGLQITLENLEKETDASLYTSYILHQFSTLDLSLINQASAGHRYAYYGLDRLVKECKLVDYQVINVVYRQEHSEALLALGPQWGNGTFSRNYLVGKARGDKSYLIYDLQMPHSVDGDAQPNAIAPFKALTQLFSHGDVRTWYQDSWLDRESATNAPTKRDFALPDHYFDMYESDFALYNWAYTDQVQLPEASAVYLGTSHDNCFMFIFGTDLVTHVDDGKPTTYCTTNRYGNKGLAELIMYSFSGLEFSPTNICIPARSGMGNDDVVRELMQAYGEYLQDMTKENAYALGGFKLLDFETQLNEGRLYCNCSFAVLPLDYEHTPWWAGNSTDGTGELAGWLTMRRQMQMECKDGYWCCTNVGTGI